MARSLSHRGPDGTSFRREGPVGLAFTRLSIVDPAGGDQPLVSEDGTVTLIANGEIYNHRELAATLAAGTRFKTDSDCEVLLHLYQRDGLDFLSHVRGIYAIVIWDNARHRLVFARDRFGIKPLYYHRNAERIIFASEIKALFTDPACPRKLDWERCLADQMTTSASAFETSEPITYFHGIESVPAAQVITVTVPGGEISQYPYWCLPSFSGGVGATATELVAAYRDAVRAAVEESCMSDAEIGLFLSGGVDSATVAAFAQVPGKLHAFTALNGGTLANGDGEYAHRIAAALGLAHHEVIFGADRYPSTREWQDLVWQLETPLCGPEQYYKYELHRFARSTRPNLKVMLLGQASDEFNGGYSTALAGGGEWQDFTDSLRQMGLRRALQTAPGLAAWWEHEQPLLKHEAIDAATAKLMADPYDSFIAWKYRDIQQYNCWHEDRTAAANGIEARVPFLDHRIIEVTAAIPRHLRAELLWDKRILRMALRDALPAALLERPKVSFYYGTGEHFVTATFAAMLAQDGEALVEKALSGPQARRFIDPDGVRATLRRLCDEPARGHINFLLRVVNLGLLEQLLAEPHYEMATTTRTVQPEVEITDWDAQRQDIEGRVLGAQQPDLAAIPVLADDVMLVQAVPPDGSYYIIVAGSIEYVVDEATDPGWLRLLLSMDGEHTLAQVIQTAGTSAEDIGQPLRDALGAGVVRLLTAVSPSTDPASVGAGQQGGTDPEAVLAPVSEP